MGAIKRTEQGLICTTTSSNNANHSSRAALHNLLGTAGKFDASLSFLGVMADDSNVVPRRAAQRTAVANLLLNVGHDGTFGDRAKGQDVSDGQGSVFTSVDELAGVHAFVGDEGLDDILVLVWVTERDFGQGGASAWVVDDLLHHAAGVSVSLSIVEGTELSRSLVETGVGRCKEDGGLFD